MEFSYLIHDNVSWMYLRLIVQIHFKQILKRIIRIIVEYHIEYSSKITHQVNYDNLEIK